MSNAAEQIFFYGQVTDPAHASSFDVLTYLDLTNGGTILFQAIILITIIICFLPDLAPLTLTGVQRFIFSPIRSLLHDIHWAVQQLSNGESRKSFYRLCYANAQDTILNSNLVQLTFIGILWFFPTNRPLSTACRLWALAAGSKWMYISALIPGHHYLNGITAGFSPMGRDRYEDCLADMARSGLPARWTKKQWLASYRCSGVETGLELYETVKDRAQWLVPPVDSEVRHLRVLAFMAVLIPTLVIGLWLFYALCSKVAALRRGMALAVNGEPRPTECEAYLWNLSKSLETANEKLQQCIATREAEFQAEKQRLEETVRHQTDFTSRRIQSALRQAKDAHAGIIDELKRKVVQLENNLTMARAEAQFVVVDEVDAAREQFLKDRIVQLEKQLAGAKKKSNARSKKELQTVKDELQTRTDELTTLTDKLSEAETRVSAAEERGRRVEIECEKLLTQGLSSLKSELQTRTDELAAAEERLATAEKSSQQGELEHDQLKNELQTRTDELAAAKERLAAAKEHSPQDEAEREQTHIPIQEFQSLKSELQTRTDELADAEKRLAAARSKHNRQAKPEREQNLAQSQEIQSLKIELQIRTDKLAAAEKRLTAARKHSQQNEAERDDQNQKLQSLKDELQSRTDELNIWTERCLSVESRLLAAEKHGQQEGHGQRAAIEGQQHLSQEQEQELQSLKDALQTRTDELQACTDKTVDVEKRLVTAEEHGRESETQLQELLAQNQNIIAEYEAFRATHQANLQHSQSLEAMQQELAAAHVRNHALQQENNSVEIEAQLMVAKLEFDLDEAQRQLAEAQFSGASAQQSMQEGEVACNLSVAEARAQAEQARNQAFMMQKNLDEVTEENRTLQIQI
ncbi:uncharacterized protein BO95DRAFT_238923 [Aspergillus brunneoviolaceus CBS 621.78]|uniref:Uncharacterized protein n=1 Tax=Aspergillus brunneoviolaceus CBS 621.78 TaxID=1450534 RepID=A0ACD1FZ19_9EURO|nr:hypothetical protein BO95DRAFT_238923 [Aspergillus brunneoviolaceus CBS 621.78]RAH42230.1 hypothetical protein BO95DRAFT_238923 [Aspergillus brunneoviolaceus CBS 621.78]